MINTGMSNARMHTVDGIDIYVGYHPYYLQVACTRYMSGTETNHPFPDGEEHALVAIGEDVLPGFAIDQRDKTLRVDISIDSEGNARRYESQTLGHTWVQIEES